MNDTDFNSSRGRWFIRGLAVGVLLMATLNAVSYFFRSSSWNSLVGDPAPGDESIGFPLQVWEAGNQYGGWFVDVTNLGLNVLIATVVGAALGCWTVYMSDFLAGIIGQSQTTAVSRSPITIQFSVRGLLVATTLVAITAAVARQFVARPETLMAIYFLGPLGLVTLAMLPRRLSWQQRVAIMVPAAYTLIAVAIAVGNALGLEFDRVLMGIFLCWTPQSALAAMLISATILISHAHEQRRRRSRQAA